jgi:ketosteroid isomerase-like protein
MKKGIALLLSVFSLVACNQQKQNGPGNLEEAKEAIAASNAIYFTSFAKNDSSIFLNCYAKDACLMGDNAPIMCGREAIARFFRGGYEKGLRNGKFITTAVYGDGNEYVTEEGIGVIYDAAGNVMAGGQGKYLVLWKKTPEGWKMFRDSFSGDEEK